MPIFFAAICHLIQNSMELTRMRYQLNSLPSRHAAPVALSIKSLGVVLKSGESSNIRKTGPVDMQILHLPSVGIASDIWYHRTLPTHWPVAL